MLDFPIERGAFLRAALSAGAAAALPSRTFAQTAGTTTTVVQAGVIGALFDSGTIIAFEKGYFREAGIDLRIQQFPGSAEASQALAIRGIDALSSGPNPMIFNAKAHAVDIAIVASAGQHSPGHGAISLILRKDLVTSGRYKRPRDLKGMKLASGLMTPSHWFAEEFARRDGAGDAAAEIEPLGLPNTVQALANKALDGACINEPSASLLLERAGGVRIQTMDRFAPNFPSGWLLFGPLLSKEKTDVGKRFTLAYLRGLHDYRDAFASPRRGFAEVASILKKYNMLVTPETPSLGVPRDGAPSLVRVDDFARWQLAQGNIKQMPDVRALVDPRFLAYANAELRA